MPDATTERDVFDALDYLVSIEPTPEPVTREDYRRAMAPYEAKVASTLALLRDYAEQIEPLELKAMQERYYHFTKDQRYRASPATAGTIIAYLNEAWHGVGPWRK